jgi:hypothetical protein
VAGSERHLDAEKLLDLADPSRPLRVGLEEHVVAAVEADQPRVGNTAGELAGALEGDCDLVATMEDQRRRLHPAQQLADVARAVGGGDPQGVVTRRRDPL